MTDPEKYYNLRDMTMISPMEGQEKYYGWYAYRANGKFYYKQFRKNCKAFRGGETLNTFLQKNPDVRAYEVGKWEQS
jgi:hypothetical protein